MLLSHVRIRHQGASEEQHLSAIRPKIYQRMLTRHLRLLWEQFQHIL